MNNMLNRTMMGEYMKKQCVSRTFDSPSNASGKASFTVILNAAQFKNKAHHKVTAFGNTKGEIQREADSSNHKSVSPATEVIQRKQPQNLEEDKVFCLKMLGLQDDGNLPEIEVFDDNKAQPEDIYGEAVRIGGGYFSALNRILIPQSFYSRRLLMHELGHYKQRIMLGGKQEDFDAIPPMLREYHNMLYHENEFALDAPPLNADYYIAGAHNPDNKYRVSYVTPPPPLTFNESQKEYVSKQISDLKNPFEGKNELASLTIEKIKALAENGEEVVAYQMAKAFYRDYLSTCDVPCDDWRDLKRIPPKPKGGGTG